MSERIVKIDFDQEEQEEILYCPICEKVGLTSVLGSKILMPNEVKQPDYENWLQCLKCAWLCPIYEAEPEPSIKDSVTTIDNPFDDQSQILSIPKRNSKAGRKASAKRRRNKLKPTNDKEVNELIRKYGDNVRIIQDTSR